MAAKDPLFVPSLKGIFILLVLMGNCVKIQQPDLRLHWIFPLTSGHKKKKKNWGEELYSVRNNMAPNTGIILTALFQKLAKEKKGARHLENYIHTAHTHVYTYKAWRRIEDRTWKETLPIYQVADELSPRVSWKQQPPHFKVKFYFNLSCGII